MKSLSFIAVLFLLVSIVFFGDLNSKEKTKISIQANEFNLQPTDQTACDLFLTTGECTRPGCSWIGGDTKAKGGKCIDACSDNIFGINGRIKKSLQALQSSQNGQPSFPISGLVNQCQQNPGCVFLGYPLLFDDNNNYIETIRISQPDYSHCWDNGTYDPLWIWSNSLCWF